MEKKELLSIAMEIFPELKAKGFFTIVNGVENYFSGLLKMEVETFYKSFYEEYDVAFKVHCIYSVCDARDDARWKRLEGNSHEFRSPMLYMVQRINMSQEPAQIVRKMLTHYRANTLVIEKYSHPEYTIEALRRSLSAKGIYLVIQNSGTFIEFLDNKVTRDANNQPQPKRKSIKSFSNIEASVYD